MLANTILAAEQDFDVYNGDSLDIIITFFEETGESYDLEQWDTLTMQIKPVQTICKAAVTATLGNGLSVQNESQLYVNIDGADMNIGVGTWFYDVEAKTGNDIKTILTGKMVVTQDTTRNK